MRKISPPFVNLFSNPTKWIDVRAPVEFLAGHIPGAINLPLLNDEERHLVGLKYKQEGQGEAIKLGHELVSGEVRELRLRSWLTAAADANAVIYCFRGGLRSQTVQAWLLERGVDRPLVVGGYKALRQFLSESIGKLSQEIDFRVVGGPTGSGKTTYLHKSGQPFIDLEGLAVHRGSAFGALPEPQPSQVNFENKLAVELLRLAHLQEPVLIENESRRIGNRVVPEVLFNEIKSSPKIVLKVPFEDRVENIFKDYILVENLNFSGFQRAVMAISRKLGGLRAQEILQDLSFSEEEAKAGRGLESNRVWIRKLLLWYYDPLYKG